MHLLNGSEFKPFIIKARVVMSLVAPLARRAMERLRAADPRYCPHSHPAQRATALLAGRCCRSPTVFCSVLIGRSLVLHPRASSVPSAIAIASFCRVCSTSPTACIICPWSFSLCTSRCHPDSEALAVAPWNLRCLSRAKRASGLAGTARRWWLWR